MQELLIGTLYDCVNVLIGNLCQEKYRGERG